VSTIAIDTNLLLIATRNAYELLKNTNVDNLERP